MSNAIVVTIANINNKNYRVVSFNDGRESIVKVNEGVYTPSKKYYRYFLDDYYFNVYTLTLSNGEMSQLTGSLDDYIEMDEAIHEALDYLDEGCSLEEVNLPAILQSHNWAVLGRNNLWQV